MDAINHTVSNYGTNPTWPTENDKGNVGDYGTDPTWPQEETTYVPSQPAESKEHQFSLKDKLHLLKERVKEDIQCGGSLMGVLGVVGAGIAAGGAAVLGGPVLIAAAIGGATGVATGLGVTEAMMRWLQF